NRRDHRQRFDRILLLRPLCLFSRGNGVILRDPASAYRRAGVSQRGRACAGVADRIGVESAGRASFGGSGRRLVVVRHRPLHRAGLERVALDAAPAAGKLAVGWVARSKTHRLGSGSWVLLRSTQATRTRLGAGPGMTFSARATFSPLIPAKAAI